MYLCPTIHRKFIDSMCSSPTFSSINFADSSRISMGGKPCTWTVKVVVSNEICFNAFSSGKFLILKCALLINHGWLSKRKFLSCIVSNSSLNIFSSHYSTRTLSVNLQFFWITSTIVNLLKLFVVNSFPTNNFVVLDFDSPLSSRGLRVRFQNMSINFSFGRLILSQ